MNLPLVRWWPVISVAVAVAAFVAFAVAMSFPPTYVATARLLVGPVSPGDVETLRSARALVPAYRLVIMNDETIAASARALGVDARDLRGSMSVTADVRARQLSIAVRHSDPTTAASIANAVASGVEQRVRRTAPGDVGLLLPIDPAEPPASPRAPNIAGIVLLAMLSGAGSSTALLAALEYLVDTVKSARDLRQIAAGSALPIRQVPLGVSLFGPAPDPYALAAFGRLSRTLLAIRGPGTRGIVVFSNAGEGGDEVASNLAVEFARRGRRVHLMDHLRNALETAPPFSRQNQSQVQLLDQLPSRVDLIVISAASSERSLDTFLSRPSTITVLVARRFETRRKLVRRSYQRLEPISAHLRLVLASPLDPRHEQPD